MSGGGGSRGTGTLHRRRQQHRGVFHREAILDPIGQACFPLSPSSSPLIAPGGRVGRPPPPSHHPSVSKLVCSMGFPSLGLVPSHCQTALIAKLGLMNGEDFFPKGMAQDPGIENTPEPCLDHTVVFYEFFVVGLQFPCDPMLCDNLDLYNVSCTNLLLTRWCNFQSSYCCRNMALEKCIQNHLRSI